MKKTLTFVLLLTSITFTSCQFNTWGNWKNDHIDKGLREEIAVLNGKLIKAMSTGDSLGLKQIASPGLIAKSGSSLDSMTIQYKEQLKNQTFEIIDEYYTKNITAQNKNNLIASEKAENDYSIDYVALNKEMYVSVLKVKQPTSSAMILAIYGRYENDWKLNILRLGTYEILGKTAPQYYSDAFTYYQQKDTIDAVSMIYLASQIATPGGKFFKYKEEQVMKNFYNKVLNEANKQYQMPLTVKEVKTSPQVFFVSPEYISDPADPGIFPAIRYKTSIKLTDTVALKKENDELQKVIGKVFNGIDKNNKHIFYAAFNEIPTGTQVRDRYGFVQTIKLAK